MWQVIREGKQSGLVGRRKERISLDCKHSFCHMCLNRHVQLFDFKKEILSAHLFKVFKRCASICLIQIFVCLEDGPVIDLCFPSERCLSVVQTKGKRGF